MKKAFLILMMFFVCPTNALDVGIRYQMLDSQIAKVEAEIEVLKARLEKCQGGTKNLKIAGSVMATTAATGLSANIALHSKISKMGAAGGGGAAMIVDNRSRQQMNCDSCAAFIAAGMSAAEIEGCAGC